MKRLHVFQSTICVLPTRLQAGAKASVFTVSNNHKGPIVFGMPNNIVHTPRRLGGGYQLHALDIPDRHRVIVAATNRCEILAAGAETHPYHPLHVVE